MDEIGVVVKQEIGVIEWNYAEIKKRLTEELEGYKKTVYTDENIKVAKADVASLRKLPKEIEARRKEIKAKCLEPYNAIEEQAKELVKMVNDTVDVINANVEDFEKRRKEAVRKEIEAFWETQAEGLPESLRKKAHDKIYDPRWENVNTSKKTWKEGIQKGIQDICIDIQTIKDMKSEYEEDVLNVYALNLNLQQALQKLSQMNEQRERILEAERKKREAAERAELEKMITKESEKSEREEAEHEVAPMPKPIAEKPVEEKTDGRIRKIFTVTGNAEQIDKIKKFFVYAKVEWKEGV